VRRVARRRFRAKVSTEREESAKGSRELNINRRARPRTYRSGVSNRERRKRGRDASRRKQNERTNEPRRTPHFLSKPPQRRRKLREVMAEVKVCKDLVLTLVH